MTELVLLIVIGSVLLLFFVSLLFAAPPNSAPGRLAQTALFEMVSLPGLSFRHADRLFDPADYSMLLSRPQLAQVARQLWRDRRNLVLLWLAMMQHDVLSLWRFRRLLTRYGVSRGLGEELLVAATALGTLAFLLAVRVAVALAGPFALVAFLTKVRGCVERLSTSCATHLERLPTLRWGEVAEAWGAQAADPLPH